MYALPQSKMLFVRGAVFNLCLDCIQLAGLKNDLSARLTGTTQPRKAHALVQEVVIDVFALHPCLTYYPEIVFVACV